MPGKFPYITPEQRALALEKAKQARRSRAKPRCKMSKAIRYKCLDCSVGNAAEVGRCDIKECSLWEFRFGKNPTKEMAEEVKNIPVHGRDKELYIPMPKPVK